jgi:hypothetical protein
VARKEIVVSDLSGREIEEGRVARLTVSDHPALGSRTVELDAAVDEVEGLESSRISLVSVGVQLPGQSGTRRVVMELGDFDRLLGGRDPSEVLLAARAGGRVTDERRSRSRGSGSKAGRVDYTARDHFGQLHRGRVNEEEAALVRDNLEQANANRRRAGQPEIDPNDPAEKKRYGF